MDHSFEEHRYSLDQLCRICGERNLTHKERAKKVKPTLCESKKTYISCVYGLDIENDSFGKHSKYLCSKCLRKMYHTKNNNSRISIDDSVESMWCDYDKEKDTISCKVCATFKELQCGIQNARRQLYVAPSTTPPSEEESETAASNNESSMSMDYNTSLECNTCTINVTSSTPGPQKNDGSTPPAECNSFFDLETSPVKVCELQDSITCTMPVNNKHDMSCTAVLPMTPPNALSDSSVVTSKRYADALTSLLRQPLETPLTRTEEKLLTHLFRRKFATNKKKGGLVELKTKGQPIIVQKLVKPRKDSTKASTSTKKKRVDILKNTRQHVAGDSTMATDTQLSSEIKRLSLKRKGDVCKQAGVHKKLKLSPKETIQLKNTAGMSGRQGIECAKALKQIGIHLANEHAVRSLSNTVVSDFIEVQEREFCIPKLKKDEDKTPDLFEQQPCGRIKDLPKFVDTLLDGYQRDNLLHDHGVIPEKEIWIKIGGDHGKGSFKLTLQIANTEKPNSRLNTVIIGTAPVKDTYVNLRKFFEYGLGDDIEALKRHTWKDKSMRIFLNGDYAFLANLYGISGAAGRYFCLFCLMPKTKLYYRPTNEPLRTLAMLKADFEVFLTEGGGDMTKALEHNNCVRQPLISIDIDHVAPPYLHIMLGIVLKHHKLLEIDCDFLDKKIAQYKPNNELTELGQSLAQYGKNYKMIALLEHEIEDGTAFIEITKEDPSTSQLEKSVKLKKQIVKKLKVFEPLTARSGPVASSLDLKLDKNHIVPQVWHSRSFSGNHCKKYMQVCSDITDAVVEETELLTTNPFLREYALEIKKKFDSINEAYSKVHNLISHSGLVEIHSLPVIQETIGNYMKLFRLYYPKKVLPKHHFLEQHCVAFIRKTGVGLGVLGEQGTENSHQTMARIERRAYGQTSKCKTTAFILKEHLLQVMPDVRLKEEKLPKPRTKKAKPTTTIDQPKVTLTLEK